jgi:glutamate-1-semialdehyde 2,1-aminomutase
MDEVVTGFRWSPGGAQQAYGIRADLVTLAKILSGGLPGGAVAGRRDLLDALAAPATGGRIRHQGTFNANPLSAAAGVACLDVVRDGSVHVHCNRLAHMLRTGINACFARRRVRGVAYGEASRFNLAFDERLSPGDPATLPRVPRDALKQQRQIPLAANLTLALLLNGVHVMALAGFTSVAHTERDIERTLDGLDRAVASVEASART